MTPDPAGALTIDGFGPLPVAAPATAAEVGEIVRRCAAEGKAIYPTGGRTMRDYGTPPNRAGVALDLRRLDQVIDYPARDMTITAQAGITVARLQEVLRAEGQQLPIDVPDPERATLGGVIAANVSGPRRYGYGTLRDYVIGIGVVNDRGEETKAGGRVVKNVAGYDLCKLYVGSLGTLGVITQATLKVRPLPAVVGWVNFEANGVERLLEALELVHRSQTRPISVDFANCTDAWEGNVAAGEWGVEVGFDGSPETVEWQVQQLRQEVSAAGLDGLESGTQPATDRRTPTSDWASNGRPLVYRANLRPSALADFLKSAVPFRGEIIGEYGGRILRGQFLTERGDPDDPATVSQSDARAMLEKLSTAAVQFDGNVIVERCPSDWKPHLPVWVRPRGDLVLMKAIKAKLDPQNLFNPGRFVTDQPISAST